MGQRTEKALVLRPGIWCRPKTKLQLEQQKPHSITTPAQNLGITRNRRTLSRGPEEEQELVKGPSLRYHTNARPNTRGHTNIALVDHTPPENNRGKFNHKPVK